MMQDTRLEPTRQFLRKWGIELEDLPAYAPDIADNECLAIMGSIPEGLANEESDVDLLYLGEGELKDPLVLQMDTSYRFGVSHDEHGREINVEQLRFADLERMGERVAASLANMLDIRKANGGFLERNTMRLKMLHRIKTALPLVNGHILEQWQERLQLGEFHRFVCLSLVQDLFNQREDIVGEVTSGELRSAAWNIKCQYAPTLVAAMLASVGETNAHIKWHYKLIMMYRDVLGPARVDEVLRFAFLPVEELEQDLLGRLVAITEPVLEEIYDRQRAVRKAMLVFSHMVRYTDPAKPNRWIRTGGGGQA